jgi:hypothetical protein
MATLIGKLDELEVGLVGTIEQGQAKLMTEMRQTQPQRRGMVDLTQEPMHASMEYGAGNEGLNANRNPRHFFAVVKGWQTGVFTSWHNKVLKLVRGYPRAIHKCFRGEEDAHGWLAKRSNHKDLTDDDNKTFTTRVEPGCPYLQL